MAPKNKNRGKPASVGVKQLSTRVTHRSSQEEEVDPADLELEVCLNGPVWRSAAFCSMLEFPSMWEADPKALILIQSYSVAASAWSDLFNLTAAAHKQLQAPPLHNYAAGQFEELDISLSDLLTQMWQQQTFRERMQVAYELANTHMLLPDAAWVLFDCLPDTKAGWKRRVKVAAAAYECAHKALLANSSSGGKLPDILDVRQGLKPLEAQWLRAQLLLARTLYGAMDQGVGGSWCSGLPRSCVRNLVAVLPDDPLGARLLCMKSFTDAAKWEELLALCRCCLGCLDLRPPGRTWDTYTLANAYNKALGAFHTLGPQHPDSQAAVADALKLDRCRWVPLLVGAGALGTPGLGPLVALGSREEATAYCHNYGLSWWSDAGIYRSRDGLFETPVALGEAVSWLMDKAGLKELAQPLDNSRMCMLMYNSWVCEPAWRGVVNEVVDQMNTSSSATGGAGTPRVVPPELRPAILRSELTLLCCLAARTANMPPVDAAPDLWQGVAGMMMVTDTDSIKVRLVDCATMVHEMASRLLLACQAQEQQPGVTWAGEIAHAARTLDMVQPARVRWLWQAGEIRMAKDAAADLQQQQQTLHKRQSLAHSSSGGGSGSGGGSSAATGASSKPSRASDSQGLGTDDSLLNPGPVLFSLPAVQAMVDFLNQQALEAARGRSKGGSRGGSSLSMTTGGSGRALSSMTAAGAARGSRAVINYVPYDVLGDKVEQLFRKLYDAAGGEAAVEQWLLDDGLKQQEKQPVSAPQVLEQFLSLAAAAVTKGDGSGSSDGSSRPDVGPCKRAAVGQGIGAGESQQQPAAWPGQQQQQQQQQQQTSAAQGAISSGNGSNGGSSGSGSSDSSNSSSAAIRLAQTAAEAHVSSMLLHLFLALQEICTIAEARAPAATAAAAGAGSSGNSGAAARLQQQQQQQQQQPIQAAAVNVLAQLTGLLLVINRAYGQDCNMHLCDLSVGQQGLSAALVNFVGVHSKSRGPASSSSSSNSSSRALEAAVDDLLVAFEQLGVWAKQQMGQLQQQQQQQQGEPPRVGVDRVWVKRQFAALVQVLTVQQEQWQQVMNTAGTGQQQQQQDDGDDDKDEPAWVGPHYDAATLIRLGQSGLCKCPSCTSARNEQRQLWRIGLSQRVRQLWRGTVMVAVPAVRVKIRHARTMGKSIAEAEEMAGRVWGALVELTTLSRQAALLELKGAAPASAAAAAAAASNQQGVQQSVDGDMQKKLQLWRQLSAVEVKLWGATPPAAPAAAAAAAPAALSQTPSSAAAPAPAAAAAAPSGVAEVFPVWTAATGSQDMPLYSSGEAAVAPAAAGQQQQALVQKPQKSAEDVAAAAAAALAAVMPRASTPPGFMLPQATAAAAAAGTATGVTAAGGATGLIAAAAAAPAPAAAAVEPASSAGAGADASSSSGHCTTDPNEGDGKPVAAAGAGDAGASSSSSGGGSAVSKDSSEAGTAAAGPSDANRAAATAASSVPPSVTPKGKVCGGCGQLFPKLLKCSGCAAAGRYTGYCSRDCQAKHWKAGHKRECGATKKQQVAEQSK